MSMHGRALSHYESLQISHWSHTRERKANGNGFPDWILREIPATEEHLFRAWERSAEEMVGNGNCSNRRLTFFFNELIATQWCSVLSTVTSQQEGSMCNSCRFWRKNSDIKWWHDQKIGALFHWCSLRDSIPSLSWACQWTTVDCEHKPLYLVHFLLCFFFFIWRCQHSP